MKITIEKCDDCVIVDMNTGDVAGYRFTFEQLVKFAKWLMDNRITIDSKFVLSEDGLAAVTYDDDKSYIEGWSLRYDEESKLYKYHDPWKDDEWFPDNSNYSEELLVEHIILCFDYSMDNIVFNVDPEVAIYDDSDEDE